MKFRDIAIGVGVLLAAVYWFGQADSPFASGCIYKEEDRNWSFLTFYNKCANPINVVFCNKMSLGEIGKLFGYQTGEWDCDRHYVQTRQSFATIKWVNEQSSVASHLLSSSRYQVAACKAPFKPRFTQGTTYVCEK
ncbi:hypothetical protein HW571_28635 [Agrobacterium genomosp. 3]|uniref:hypothetical protein n=1 Tax=Agrobacterium tomkonis TaxID=1183410 RepID=UPI001CD8E61A|nr:hypothetical protein [Agrobacterium tomkonis]MCA1879914.1 hypothetical protein [Agrobacterium tumefaciens]MCA1895166.1 hypothetical protein [Agrobacterium tomkonis]